MSNNYNSQNDKHSMIAWKAVLYSHFINLTLNLNSFNIHPITCLRFKFHLTWMHGLHLTHTQNYIWVLHQWFGCFGVFEINLYLSCTLNTNRWTKLYLNTKVNALLCVSTQAKLSPGNERPLRTIWCKTITVTWSTNKNQNDRDISCLRRGVQEGILHQRKVSEKAARQKTTTFCLHPETRRGVRPRTKGRDVAMIQSYPLIPGMT